MLLFASDPSRPAGDDGPDNEGVRQESPPPELAGDREARRAGEPPASSEEHPDNSPPHISDETLPAPPSRLIDAPPDHGIGPGLEDEPAHPVDAPSPRVPSEDLASSAHAAVRQSGDDPPPARRPGDDLPSYPRTPGARSTPPPAPPAPGDDLPSYPRGRRGEPERKRSLLDRVLIGILALAAIGLIAYAVTRDRTEVPGDEVMARAVATMSDVELSVPTNDPARVSRFVRDEFGWRVGVPLFEAATLTGVGIVTVAPAVDLPVFLYQGEDERQVAVYSLNYALLDQVPDRLYLTSSDYQLLAEGSGTHTRTLRGRNIVFWRDRDDIYIAITEIPPASLTSQIDMQR